MAFTHMHMLMEKLTITDQLPHRDHWMERMLTVHCCMESYISPQ